MSEPSFCWHCGKKLAGVPYNNLMTFYFATVKDRDGNKHRVHKQCKEAAKGEILIQTALESVLAFQREVDAEICRADDTEGDRNDP